MSTSACGRQGCCALDDHLRLPGLLEHFASQTDAYLVVNEQRIPVHSAMLAIHSPVFAELFGAAASECQSRRDKMCLPMSGHSVADVCCAVKYIYERGVCQLEDTPAKQLWRSVKTARPIIMFAHKYDMKVILQECEASLIEKVQKISSGLNVSVDRTRIFSSVEATAAWASLAEECKLSNLLAQSELFMASTSDMGFWRGGSAVVQHLSQASLLRVLRAAQLDTINVKKHLLCPSAASHDHVHVCQACRRSVSCSIAQDARIHELVSWQ